MLCFLGKKQNRTQQNNKFIKDKNTAIRGKFGLQNEAGKSKFNKKNGNRGYRRNDRKADRMPSLIVGSDWEMVEEFDLPQLLKLAANQPTSEDLAWCGHLDQCDDNYDKVTTRTGKVLRKFENKLFYYVTTMDDPVIEKLAVGEIGDVFATDAILAQLMAAPRSVYSWDIIIQKVNGKIFLDKRDNSNFDYLTVSETANDPPTITDDMPEYNYPDNLSLEATKINQNFSQQVLRSAENNRKQVRKLSISIFPYLTFNCL